MAFIQIYDLFLIYLNYCLFLSLSMLFCKIITISIAKQARYISVQNQRLTNQKAGNKMVVCL